MVVWRVSGWRESKTTETWLRAWLVATSLANVLVVTERGRVLQSHCTMYCFEFLIWGIIRHNYLRERWWLSIFEWCCWFQYKLNFSDCGEDDWNDRLWLWLMVALIFHLFFFSMTSLALLWSCWQVLLGSFYSAGYVVKLFWWFTSNLRV